MVASSTPDGVARASSKKTAQIRAAATRSLKAGRCFERAAPQKSYQALPFVGKGKPASFKGGNFIKTIAISSSMSPSVHVASTEFSKY